MQTHLVMAADTRQWPDISASQARVLLVFVVSVAALLRFLHLNSQLWIDEYIALSISRSSFVELLTTYQSTNQHPLFALLAHLSIQLFGEEPWALRLPAALLGAATIPLLYACARLVASRTEALLACSLLAVSYHHIWFSQNARGYTGMAFFVLLGSYLFLLAWREREGKPTLLWLGYGVAMALGIYTHLTMAFVLLAHALIALAALLVRARRSSRGRWSFFLGLATAVVLSVLLHAPMIESIYPKTVAPLVNQIKTKNRPLATPAPAPNTPQQAPPAAAPAQAAPPPAEARSVEEVAASDSGRRNLWRRPLWTVAETLRGFNIGSNAIFPVLLLALFTVGVLGYWRGDRLLLLLLFVPCVVTVGMMYLIWHLVFPRFLFFAIGLGFIPVARGILLTSFGAARVLRLPAPARTKLIWALGAAFILLSLPALRVNYSRPKQDFIGAMNFLESNAQPGETIAATWPTHGVYNQALGKDWPDVSNGNDLQAAMAQGRPLWVVYSLPRALQARRPFTSWILQNQFTRVRVFPGTLGDGEIIVAKYTPAQ